jgi:hypothetical protein
MRRRSIVAIAALHCLAVAVGAAEPLKSGLQPGERLSAVFEPVNVTGPNAGKPHCLVCENGLSPVVMIFAREPSDRLVELLTQVDAATARHRKAELGSFVVFLSDQEGLDKKLADIAKKHELKQIVLAIDAPAGPEGFAVAKDADVTVVLYREHRVKANHAFRKGELDAKAIDRVVGDISKIIPKIQDHSQDH